MSLQDLSKENGTTKKEQNKSLCYGTTEYLWNNKRPHFIILLILFIISIVLIIIFVALQLSVIYSYNYAIIIDAGSTGTRAYLYEWKDARGVANDLVTEKTSCETGKLQEVYKNEKNNELLKCISKIIQEIPSSLIIKPSVYLAATAGMRLFQIENPELTDKIFKDSKDLFTKNGLNVKFSGIIDGTTEAVSGWITVNILKQTVGQNISRDKIKTFGALDLGGASTQIALENLQPTVTIDLFNDKYSLYAISYLCYGVNMFFVKYLSSVSINNKESNFNCLLKNTKMDFKDDSKTCRAKGSENINFANMSKTILPNSLECRRQITDLLLPLIPNKVIDQDRKFVAVSSFYYYQDFLKRAYNISNTFPSFMDSTNKFCGEDYLDLATKYPSDSQYAWQYCFVGNYIISLLQLYGFTENSFKNIEFVKKVNNIGVGWNLGYITEQTRYIPDSIIYRLNNILFIVVVALCATFIVLITILFLLSVWVRRQKVENINV